MNPPPEGRPRARPDPERYFLWEPLEVHAALALRGSAEERVLRVIEEEFYHGRNRGGKAVPISYTTFCRRTGLSNGQINEAIKLLEGQRIIAVLGGRRFKTKYAVRPSDEWVLKPKRRPTGAADPRRRWALRAARKTTPGTGCSSYTDASNLHPLVGVARRAQ